MTLLTAALTPLAALAQDGPVAHYPLDGDGADLSGNALHATVHGTTPTADRFGFPDTALAFDGIDDHLIVAHAPTLDLTEAMTLSLWLRIEATGTPGTFYTLAEKSDPERGGHARWGLWLIGGLVEACVEPAVGGAQRCLDGVDPLDLGRWNHVVATYDGTTLALFLDGRPAGARTFAPSPIARSSFELFVGGDRYDPRPAYLRGALDDLRIYDRVLNAEEIERLRQLEPTPAR